MMFLYTLMYFYIPPFTSTMFERAKSISVYTMFTIWSKVHISVYRYMLVYGGISQVRGIHMFFITFIVVFIMCSIHEN